MEQNIRCAFCSCSGYLRQRFYILYQDPYSLSTCSGSRLWYSTAIGPQQTYSVSWEFDVHTASTHALSFPDRRSFKYSNRPRLVMAGEILTGNLLLAFLGYGDQYVLFNPFIQHTLTIISGPDHEDIVAQVITVSVSEDLSSSSLFKQMLQSRQL